MIEGQSHSEESKKKIRIARERQPSARIGRWGVTKEAHESAVAAGKIWCRDCHRYLDVSEFTAKTRSRCAYCNREKSRRTRLRIRLDPEAYAASVKQIRNAESQGREGRKQRNRKKVLSRYRVSPEWYDQKLSEQGNVCGICQQERSNAPHAGSFCIDHNHATGQLRGLLCFRCNTSLERLEVSGWIEKAQAYLQRYQKLSAD